MEFTERYDVLRCQYLASLSFNKMREFIGKSAKNDDERRKIHNNIQRFCKGVIEARGQMIRQFRYSLSTPLESGGRLFGSLSLQGLPKKVRGFLVRDSTVDIDMVNAHPVILSYLCKKHHIHAAELNNYIANRDRILASFDDRDKAKTLFLIAVNTDKEIRHTSPVLRKFDKEMKDIQSQLTRLSEYMDITESVPDDRKDNWNGSAINRILCMYENKILQEAMSVLNRNSVEVFTPMFDGVLVYGKNWTDGLLQEVQDSVNSKFPGLDMKWSIKEHDDEIQIPDDWEPAEEDVEGEPGSPYDAGQLLMSLHPHYVTCRDELYVWLPHNGMWSCSKTDRLAIAQRFHTKLGKYATDTNRFSNMDAQMKSMKIDDDFINRTQDSSLGFVLFKDCIWDCYHGRTIPFTPEIAFYVQMPNEYPVNVPQEDMDLVNKVLYLDPLGSVVGKYRRTETAKSLAGVISKTIRVSVGSSGNNGKSLYSKALGASIGQYFCEFDAANLLVRKHGGDDAQRMRPFFLNRWRRLAVSQEIKVDPSCVADATLTKKFSSGGDTLIGRVHGGLETPFRPHYTLDINCNEMFEFDKRDTALYNRIRVTSFDRVFYLPGDKPDHEIFNADGSLKSERVRRADESLTNMFKQKRYQQALVALLIKTFDEWRASPDKDWVPTECLIAKEEHYGSAEDGTVLDSFLQSYEITNNPNDYVSNPELKEWLQASKINSSTNTLNRAIKDHLVNGAFASDQTKYIKTTRDKKTLWFWFGIRRIPDSDDDSGCFPPPSLGRG